MLIPTLECPSCFVQWSPTTTAPIMCEKCMARFGMRRVANCFCCRKSKWILAGQTECAVCIEDKEFLAMDLQQQLVSMFEQQKEILTYVKSIERYLA